MILEKTGANVQELFDQLGGLVAKEKVTEERLNTLTGMPLKVRSNQFNSPSDHYQVQQDEYSYFIVRKDNLLQAEIDEYRRDADGLQHMAVERMRRSDKYWRSSERIGSRPTVSLQMANQLDYLEPGEQTPRTISAEFDLAHNPAGF